MTHPGATDGRPGCGLDAAPYLLGALEPGEASAFVRHLAGCAVCRDEVAALAPVLDALSAAAPAQPAPRALRRRVLRTVRAEPKAAVTRRPRRIRGLIASPPAGWLALGAAMAAAAVVQLAPTRSHERVIPSTLGAAQLRLSAGRGELVVAHLPPLPVSRTYEVWLQSDTGRLVPSTLFRVTTQGAAEVEVPGDLRDARRLLVTVEPRGGSLYPTTRAVIAEPLT